MRTFVAGRSDQAAVAADLRVSSFLGPFFAGADAAAGVDFACVPLLLPEFNFLGFFFSAAALDEAGLGAGLLAACGWAAGFCAGVCFCEADRVVGPVDCLGCDVPFVFGACVCWEEVVLAVGASLGLGASFGLGACLGCAGFEDCWVLDVFCCLGACSLCLG